MPREKTEPTADCAPARTASAPANRRVVFLSHANPEDNPFALWLGARLTAAGYTVWSDLLQLTGGERFWKDINDAIRHHTAVFLPILSNASIDPAKEGVHNEIAIATTVRRALKLDHFIVPLRLERISEIPAQLIQLTYIDFAANWADGLAQLLERLEKSAVPKEAAPETAAMRAWATRHASLSGSIVDQPETLQSNWFPIRELPAHIHFYGTPVAKDLWEQMIAELPIPCRPFLRLLIAFAPIDAVQAAAGPDIPVSLEYRVPIDDFLDGARRDAPHVPAADARNIVTDLVRQAWETFAQSRGLKRHTMASAECWYVPHGLLEKDRARFRDADGKARWRAMGGVRGKRRIRWSYGVSVRPALAEPSRLIVQSRAVFSEDGASLVTDGKRALRLRKWLCKSWWNDDFRDRLLGLMAVLSGDQPVLRLPLGGDAVVVVDALPLAFTAPLTYAQHTPAISGESGEDPEDETVSRDDTDALDADDAIHDEEDDDLNDDDSAKALGAP